MRISYFKDHSGNYLVTLVGYSQTIVVMTGYFRKVMEMKGNVVVGCCDVDLVVLNKLGFVVPGILVRKIV
jgi:hypothetical protein